LNIIYEYESIGNNLTSYIKSTPTIQKYFKSDFNTIKATQYCGIINDGNEDYFILPKISNNNKQNLNIFTYMLLFANDIKINNKDLASTSNLKSNNILEVFIQIFVKNLIKELQKGLYKNYINKEENSRVLKGKYLINENIKYNFSNSKIYCSYDEFSSDNELNQFFLYAIKTLSNFTSNKKLLKKCELIFDEVEYKRFDINNININFTRLNNRFKHSYEIALLLLKKLIPTFNKDKKSFAFLFDMNVLFENFIGNIYKQNNHKIIIQKGNKQFDSLYLRPDIINEFEIIDCKYKSIQKDELSSRDDRYQMYVYANNYNNIESTMLLYPKHFDEIKKDITLGVNNKKVFLKIRTIDLNCNNICYNNYIELIKNRIKSL